MPTKLFLLLIPTLIFTACTPHSSGTGPQNAQTRPSFILNPSIEGRMGGVGIARPHIKGVSAQRELAISRAIDEIARQKGTRVQSWQAIQTTGTRESASTHMEAVSIQTTSGETIQAIIRQMWEDPATKELYVWMLTQ
ncbi:hypothetical protein [Desulfobotulus sp.]|jgi:hypothetical protein|uniref:hypothetical protein n=1 Tax=Desulfobotulus sp. TaxID=1940337 RepID=UPI002A36F771|nr:hypothetical protein [Desulfobotulus sp.]MDY0164090.1 hypothetical protein [Desulfobotulus sp.]